MESNVYNNIYIRQNNEILNIKIVFNHMDVVDAIEDYINDSNIYFFEVLDEKNIKKKFNLKTSFFPYVGTFRMEGNLKKTNNYFVPGLDDGLILLIDLYNEKNNLVTFKNLQKLYELNKKNKILSNLCLKMDIELLERFDLNTLNSVINNSTKQIDLEYYKKIKFILETAKLNEEKLSLLGLDFKFEKYVSKQKVKENKYE